MSTRQKNPGSPFLYDEGTGDIVGLKDPDGSEMLFSRAANYGVFYDLSQQTDGSNAATPIQFDTPILENGIRIVDGSKITFDRGGVFTFTLTAQVENADSSIHSMYLWGRLNGVDIPNSLTRYSVTASHGGSSGAIVVERSYVGVLSAGQYIEVVWSSSSADITLEYRAATTAPNPVRPATPSVYLSVHEVAK